MIHIDDVAGRQQIWLVPPEVVGVEFAPKRQRDFIRLNLARYVFEIIPPLTPGAIVHFYDMFLPSDNPKDWVITAGRSSN